MGHITNPIGFRLPKNKLWENTGVINTKNYKQYLQKNFLILEFAKNIFMNYSIPIFDFQNARNNKNIAQKDRKIQQNLIPNVFVINNIVYSKSTITRGNGLEIKNYLLDSAMLQWKQTKYGNISKKSSSYIRPIKWKRYLPVSLLTYQKNLKYIKQSKMLLKHLNRPQNLKKRKKINLVNKGFKNAYRIKITKKDFFNSLNQINTEDTNIIHENNILSTCLKKQYIKRNIYLHFKLRKRQFYRRKTVLDENKEFFHEFTDISEDQEFLSLEHKKPSIVISKTVAYKLNNLVSLLEKLANTPFAKKLTKNIKQNNIKVISNKTNDVLKEQHHLINYNKLNNLKKKHLQHKKQINILRKQLKLSLKQKKNNKHLDKSNKNLNFKRYKSTPLKKSKKENENQNKYKILFTHRLRRLKRYPIFLQQFIMKQRHNLFVFPHKNIFHLIKIFCLTFTYIINNSLKHKLFFLLSFQKLLLSLFLLPRFKPKFFLLRMLNTLTLHEFSVKALQTNYLRKFISMRFLLFQGVNTALISGIHTIEHLSKCVVSFIGMHTRNIHASLIKNYIIHKLGQYFTIQETLKPILYDLRTSPILQGFKIIVAGRITRKERAAFIIKRQGKMTLNKKTAPIDYSSSFKIMKFGLVGVKVFLYFKTKRIEYYTFNFNTFNINDALNKLMMDKVNVNEQYMDNKKEQKWKI